MAWGASVSGYVRSMTGVIFPDSMSSLRTIRSSWFPLETKRRQLLVDEPGQQERPELAIGASEPPAARLSSGDDERPLRGEGPPQA
jgi:hypothetical protein